MSRTRGPEQMPSSRQPLDDLFAVTYQELRRLAARVKRDDGHLTISPTALVNEAWMKLAGSASFEVTSPLHFKRLAARAMRQVLVEVARRHHAAKRGHGALRLVVDDDTPAAAASHDLIALHDALDALAAVSPRQASLVEARFFGGLDVKETADLLGVSEATVMRDWRVARAWLAVELRRP